MARFYYRVSPEERERLEALGLVAEHGRIRVPLVEEGTAWSDAIGPRRR